MNTNPLERNCYQINEIERREKFSHTVVLKFQGIKPKCNFNYSIELTPNSLQYFSSPGSPFYANTKTILVYNMDVLSPVLPYFTKALSGENNTVGALNGTNSSEIVIANRKTIQVDPDRNIELG